MLQSFFTQKTGFSRLRDLRLEPSDRLLHLDREVDVASLRYEHEEHKCIGEFCAEVLWIVLLRSVLFVPQVPGDRSGRIEK